MVFSFLRCAAFFLGVMATNASQDWILKFEELQEVVRTASRDIKEADVLLLDDLAKSASNFENRLAVLGVIPGLFKNAHSQYITSIIRSSLRFLVETSVREEQQKQVEVLGELATVLREFPPSPEDDANLKEIRNMLEILTSSDKDLDTCLLAVECSMSHSFFPWARRDTERLVPLLCALLDGVRTIHGNPKARAKAALYLSQLIEPKDCDFVMGVLESPELSSPDVVPEVIEGYKYLAKIAGTLGQRALLRGFLESQIEHPDSKVRRNVAEGLQSLAEKSEGLDERQKLRLALGLLAIDEDREVIIEVSNGFKYLAIKAREALERKIIQEFVQVLFQDYDKNGMFCWGAIEAYRELVANSESADERRILREIVPNFLTYLSGSKYWLAASVCKTFFAKATEPEERLFLGKKLLRLCTPENEGFSDVGYDMTFIFVDWAEKATTQEERQTVFEGLTKLYSYPHDKIAYALAALYETDCKAQVQEFVEGSLKKLDGTSHKGVEILKLLSEKTRTGADLDWIKTAYISVIETDGPGTFWYAQEEIVIGCKKLCANIADIEERRKVKENFDAVIQKREEKTRAAYDDFYAKYGAFPGDD